MMLAWKSNQRMKSPHLDILLYALSSLFSSLLFSLTYQLVDRPLLLPLGHVFMHFDMDGDGDDEDNLDANVLPNKLLPTLARVDGAAGDDGGGDEEGKE